MIAAFNFDTNHADLVHDIAYDYYGQRLVTVSSDQKIKVWDYVESNDTNETGSWTLRESWKGHDAPALKISWAHPEFGSFFATCSFDKTVKVWEEVITTSMPSAGAILDDSLQVKTTPKVQSATKWVERARINDFRGPVQDIQFAPHHHGLKLATVASDGIVRIYEATNPTNISSWTLVDEFDALEESLTSSPSLMSTNGFPAGGALVSPTSGIGKASNSGGHSSKVHPLSTGLQTATGLSMDALFCLSWCDHKLLPPALAVGCGLQNCVKIFRVGHHNRWQAIESIGHADVVTAVAWAPCMGRSYHLIATSSKDGHVCIFKFVDDVGMNNSQSVAPPSLKTPPLTYANAVGSSQSAKAKRSMEKIADFPDHHSEVWRVEWNITGTILTSSGDDGKVRIWSATYPGEWKCLSVISTDQNKPSSNEAAATAKFSSFPSDPTPKVPSISLSRAAEAWEKSDEMFTDIPKFF